MCAKKKRVSLYSLALSVKTYRSSAEVRWLMTQYLADMSSACAGSNSAGRWKNMARHAKRRRVCVCARRQQLLRRANSAARHRKVAACISLRGVWRPRSLGLVPRCALACGSHAALRLATRASPLIDASTNSCTAICSISCWHRLARLVRAVSAGAYGVTRGGTAPGATAGEHRQRRAAQRCTMAW